MTHKFTAVTKDNCEYINSQQKGMEYSNGAHIKQNADKTFEELVEESIRLPSLSPSSNLPMTMTEILRSSQQAKDLTTKLPQIHSGQVQLVTRSDGIPSERKRRRGKKSKLRRPERPLPRATSDNANSVRVSYAKPSTDLDATKAPNTEQLQWKKKLHRRQSKRRMAEENDSVNVSIKISGYQQQNIEQTCRERKTTLTSENTTKQQIGF